MKEIFDLLNQSDWYDGNEHIQIAKGKYELPKTTGELLKKVIRKFKVKK